MTETGKFLSSAERARERLRADLDVDNDPRLRCDGCGDWHFPDDLTPGEAGTWWCSGCRDDAPAPPAPAFDCIVEDDGDP